MPPNYPWGYKSHQVSANRRNPNPSSPWISAVHLVHELADLPVIRNTTAARAIRRTAREAIQHLQTSHSRPDAQLKGHEHGRKVMKRSDKLRTQERYHRKRDRHGNPRRRGRSFSDLDEESSRDSQQDHRPWSPHHRSRGHDRAAAYQPLDAAARDRRQEHHSSPDDGPGKLLDYHGPITMSGALPVRTDSNPEDIKPERKRSEQHRPSADRDRREHPKAKPREPSWKQIIEQCISGLINLELERREEQRERRRKEDEGYEKTARRMRQARYQRPMSYRQRHRAIMRSPDERTKSGKEKRRRSHERSSRPRPEEWGRHRSRDPHTHGTDVLDTEQTAHHGPRRGREKYNDFGEQEQTRHSTGPDTIVDTDTFTNPTKLESDEHPTTGDTYQERTTDSDEDGATDDDDDQASTVSTTTQSTISRHPRRPNWPDPINHGLRQDRGWHSTTEVTEIQRRFFYELGRAEVERWRRAKGKLRGGAAGEHKGGEQT